LCSANITQSFQHKLLLDGIDTVNVNIVFEPEWNKDMMSEEAKLELGFL
jgi:metal-sulfur cluster biosynthetic enzyme